MIQATSKNQHAVVMSDAEIQHWVNAVRRLPDLRVDKVVAVRDALRRNRYDDEHVLAETIARIERVLCTSRQP